MNARGWAALAILALLCFAASKSHADERSILPRHQRPGPITCKVVRGFVDLLGSADEAEKFARAKGATEVQLAAARKCLQDPK